MIGRSWVLLVAACACSSAPPPASTGTTAPSPPVTPVTPSKSTVSTEHFHSDALGVDKDVRIWLPAGYDASGTRRYPVLYYLHGLGRDENDWLDLGKLDQVADGMGLEAIVVMPDGDNNFYFDSTLDTDYAGCMKDGAGMFIPTQSRKKTCVKTSRYETYMIHDLIHWVDSTYRTIASREGRGIAGLSMGGFGALMLAMRHPDLFAVAASHSGVDALTYKGPYPYDKAKAGLYTEVAAGSFNPIVDWIRKLFGPDIATWRAHDPAVLVDKLAPGSLALYLDCGTEDEFALHNGMQYLHDKLLDRHIEHAYYLGPGHHDFHFWAVRLPFSLAFLRDHVARPR